MGIHNNSLLIVGISSFIFTIVVNFASTCPLNCKCFSYPFQRALCEEELMKFPVNISENTVFLTISGTEDKMNSLTKIQRSFINPLPALKGLVISYSNVEIVEDLAFREFPILEELDLSGNRIGHLHQASFGGLDKLKSLDLTGNKNISFEYDAFKSLRNIEKLYLGENGISKLKQILFQGLDKLKTLDLHGNDIVEFEFNFFGKIKPLQYLDISGNRLQQMPKENLKELGNITTLHVKHNPWHCNCEMIDVKNYLQKAVYDPRNIMETLYCSSPPSLRNLPLRDVADSKLTCSPPKDLTCDSSYVSVSEGEDIIVRCALSGGDPKPYLVVKSPNGRVYSYMNDTSSTYFATKTGQFFIRGASMSDDGAWIFLSRNGHGGDIQRNVTISVQQTTMIKTTTTSAHTPNKIINIDSNHSGETKKAPYDDNKRNIAKSVLSKTLQAPEKERRVPMNQEPSTRSLLDTKTLGVIIAITGGCSFITTGICLMLIYVCKRRRLRNKVTPFVD